MLAAYSLLGGCRDAMKHLKHIYNVAVVVEGHSAKSVALASATVSFVNLDITPK